MTVPIRNNDGFRPILVETETALPREKRCPRRVMLGWPHLIAIVTVSVLLGVAFTTQIHCNDDHPTQLRIPSAKTTAVKLNITAETTAVKLNVNTGVPETLPNTGKWPKVAWLMSFPNSGTSFTTKMVRHLSHMSTSTNYGEEFLNAQGNSIPIYENSTVGPFWVDPQEGASFEFERPTIFAFTKTHCGGRCEKCGPSQYVENPHSFLMQCLSGKIAHRSSDGEIVKEVVQYDLELVQRAVHLIRNPFDNVVSRFHLELHGFDSQKLKQYPNSREGFRNFCFYLNTIFEKEEESSRLMDPKVWELMKDVPCRDDFFRFAQWHNLAFVTTQSMGIPTLVVHYENYETKYNETAHQMLEFLHLPPKGELIDFFTGKEYDYFSPAEQDNVKKAMEIMALSFTWDQLSHYFE